MPRTDTDAFAAGAALFEDMITLRDFMRDKVRAVVERFDKEDGTVRALFLRGLGWLGTLAELKHPQHFQAALAGTRTLLELSIDLALHGQDAGMGEVGQVESGRADAEMLRRTAVWAPRCHAVDPRHPCRW